MKDPESSCGVMILAAIILGTFFSGFVRQYLIERKEWNNGVCRSNGVKWEFSSRDNGTITYKAGTETLRITFKSIGDKNAKGIYNS